MSQSATSKPTDKSRRKVEWTQYTAAHLKLTRRCSEVLPTAEVNSSKSKNPSDTGDLSIFLSPRLPYGMFV